MDNKIRIAVFGSSRPQPGTKLYEEARMVGRALAGAGWTIITGGYKGIMQAVSQGAKEVWITSQDCANYNLENRKQKLPELLNKILNLPHRFKLRLGMSDPNNILPILSQLIETFKHPKMYKFLHIPIHHSSLHFI